MAHIEREKKILEQLVQAREAVKRKYELLKYERNSTEQALNETFKPIIDPLQKLVKKQKKLDSLADIKKEENDDNILKFERNITQPILKFAE